MYVTMGQLAVELGVSYRTILRSLREGRIPERAQVNHRRRWPLDDVEVAKRCLGLRCQKAVT